MSDQEKPKLRWGQPTSATASGGIIPLIVNASAGGLTEAATGFIVRMSEHPVTLNIPPRYLEKVGRMIALWAHVEWKLAGVLCALLNIDRKEGRALFTGRSQDLWDKIKRLIKLKNILLKSDWATFATNLQRGEDLRNLVGHAVWMNDKDTGELCLQNPSGQWVVENKNIGSKKHDPEKVSVDDAWFDSNIALMEQWLADALNFSNEITDALSPSQGKLAQQMPQDQNVQAQNQEPKA